MNTIIFVLKSWRIAPTKSYNPLCDAHQKQGEIQILWSLDGIIKIQERTFKDYFTSLFPAGILFSLLSTAFKYKRPLLILSWFLNIKWQS